MLGALEPELDDTWDLDSRPLTGGSNSNIPQTITLAVGNCQSTGATAGKITMNEATKPKALHHTVSSRGVSVHAVARWF